MTKNKPISRLQGHFITEQVSKTRVQFEGTHNIMVVAVSLGIGMITLAVPNFYQNFPSWAQVILHSGITAGSITAIVLNVILNGIDTKTQS